MHRQGNEKRKVSGVIDEGIMLVRGKGSSNEVTEWTPRLKEAVAAARLLYVGDDKAVKSNLLIHGKDGRAIKKNQFDSAWQRLIAKAMQNGLSESFTFHDIKAKGVSDHTDKASGHKTKKMQKIYDRVPARIKATK
jgi:hypothetical protein